MSVFERFQSLAVEWRQHCQKVALSSRTEDYLNHPAYRELIALGAVAVPFVMDRLPSEEEVPWEFVLEEITDVRFIDDPGSFSPEEVRQKRLQWWATRDES